MYLCKTLTWLYSEGLIETIGYDYTSNMETEQLKQWQVPQDCSGVRAVICSDLHMSYQKYSNALLQTSCSKKHTYTETQISSEYFNFTTNKTLHNPDNMPGKKQMINYCYPESPSLETVRI